MTTITFTPELHSRINDKGLQSIMIRLTQNRKHKRKELGYAIEKKHWNPKQKKVRTSHPLHAIINTAIKTKIQELEQHYLESLANSDLKTIHEIGKTEKLSFTQYFKKYVENLKKGATKSAIGFLGDKLMRFKKEIYFEEINSDFITQYKKYLSDLGNNDTTIALSFSVIRLVYNKAIRDNYYKTDKASPFLHLQFKKAKFSRTKLTQEDIAIIENLDLSNQSELINHTRNIFLLCYYLMGVRISSMVKMTWNNIQDNRCIYVAAKSDKKINALIGKKAQEILDKYDKNTRFIFPFLSEDTIVDDSQEYFNISRRITARLNHFLKTIEKLSGIEKHLSTHVARSSFAYNARKISGGDIYAVQKALGHSSITTTELYFASDETIEADNLSTLLFD